MANSNLPANNNNFLRRIFGGKKQELEVNLAEAQRKIAELEGKVRRIQDENGQLKSHMARVNNADIQIAKANENEKNAREEAANARKEAQQAKIELQNIKAELDRVKKLYADENGIDGQEKQVDRDSGVNAMLEKLQELQSQISKFQNSEFEKSEKDERQINEMQKTLYARLFGIVSAYRDTLPPNEVPIHPVGDKTIDKFCTMLGDEIFKKMGTNREDYQINRQYKTQNMDSNIAGNIYLYYINALRAMCGSDDFDRVLKKRATNDIDLYDVLADQLLNDINFIDGPKIPPTDFGIKSVGVAAKGVEEIIAKDEGR